MVRHSRSLVVGGGWDENLFWVCSGILCKYSQLRPPRATAAQSGGAWAAPRRTGAGDSDTKLDTIKGGFTMLGICAVLPWLRRTSQVTYKLGRRCTAMVMAGTYKCVEEF